MILKIWKFITKKKRRVIFFLSTFLLFVFFLFCLPNVLFNKPTSSLLLDKNGQLLTAQIAKDEQWRFPHNDSVPQKFKTCLIAFEDHRYESHFGVSPRSIARAIKQNISEGRVVSGASTITMQVIRMSRDNPSRTFFEKFTEMIRAVRLETKYSKDEILAFYASNAPMGGNVVGVDAASWRYFGRNPNNLSWAEAATLAVLPNAPSLIYPGKNQKKLFDKRNRLLKKLKEDEVIDEFTYSLSILEELPQKPHRIPQVSPQLMALINKKVGVGKRSKTTIDKDLQLQAMQIIQRHNKELKKNHIHNAAIIIIDVKNNDVLAYIGNTKDAKNEHQNLVDIIRAPRSTGSILKPFLYAMMLNDGELLPHMLVKDVPAHFAGYTPKNYAKSNEGAVTADRALSKSLNVPAVFMLQEYGVKKFHHQLKTMNFSNLYRPSSDYGLALILGGAEASLWDITNAYSAMSRDLLNFTTLNGEYYTNNYTSSSLLIHKKEIQKTTSESSVLDAASIYFTFDAMLKVNRPDNELGWENFSSSRKIAWKTGTSFGFRDAWAVGVTPDYVVGVWVGNADGEGRPGVVGVKAAAPILFDVFDLLPAGSWFSPAYDDMQKVNICQSSGYRASEHCNDVKMENIPLVSSKKGACPYHKTIHINKAGEQVYRTCEKSENIISKTWFVLPAIQEWYYKRVHPTYKTLPPFSSACETGETDHAIDLIYPKNNSQIYIPKDLDGKLTKIIFKAAYKTTDRIIYWHLNNEYLGETKTIHHMEVRPEPGKYRLTLIDENGISVSRNFEILEKK